ncbi:unnamed protein product [Durusdinium trenchii]|uniref:Cyclic nucleotide-binding domain-containing protein n=2 Tax=Durusdinium trenchii TaxID=1381693 RepID=A0ABP0MRD0_9DINO
MDGAERLIEVLSTASHNGLIHRGLLQNLLKRLSINALEFEMLLAGMDGGEADGIDVSYFISFLYSNAEPEIKVSLSSEVHQAKGRKVSWTDSEEMNLPLAHRDRLAFHRTLTAGRMPTLSQIDDYSDGDRDSVKELEPGEDLVGPKASDCPSIADFGNLRADDSDVEELEPATMLSRRGGVSAVPTGAFAARFVNWVSPHLDKKAEHHDILLESLAHCPFFVELDQEILHALVDTMEIEEFEPGDAIYKKGDVGRSGYVMISGSAIAETDAAEASNLLKRSSRSEVHVKPGDFFGEHTMLWGFKRRMMVRTVMRTVVGKLKRDVYFNIVTRSAMHERSQREKYLRNNVPMFETFDDELIAKIADIMERRSYVPNQRVVEQGDEGSEFFIVLKGECVASIRIAKVGCDGFDEHPVRHYSKGERFGELAFINHTPRAATITATTHTQLLCLDRIVFERVVGSLDIKQKENYASDPRKILADFYSPGGGLGPRGVSTVLGNLQTSWFAVYRPTSRDALAKLLNQTAVGKGLNVKGKSAKRNHLSGFVPFLQISDNKHKRKLGKGVMNARVRVYFQTHEAQELVKMELASIMRELESQHELEPIRIENSYPNVYGIEMPELLLREAYIMRPDITWQVGWETGRASEPAFMEMNLHAVRSKSLPKVVLYQYDNGNPMNPHGLLIAYAEAMVKPVVSDFDTFTVGSRGMMYEPICEEQQALMMWSLQCTERILQSPDASSWNSRWLEVLEEADRNGFHPEIPEFGFGDPTSYRLTKEVIEATKMCGAVRHGSECFNFYFPQELDSEYLIIWDGFEGKPWSYRNCSGLVEFLLARAHEGYSFPLNPVWPVRDEGWYEVFDTLRKSPDAQDCLAAWFPRESGVVECIERLHKRYRDGFQVMADQCHELPDSSQSAHWLKLREFVRRGSCA